MPDKVASSGSHTTSRYMALLRKKKIERGWQVSPTPEELALDNVVEEGSTVLSNVFGHMVSQHREGDVDVVKKSGRSVQLGEADALRVAALLPHREDGRGPETRHYELHRGPVVIGGVGGPDG